MDLQSLIVVSFSSAELVLLNSIRKQMLELGIFVPIIIVEGFPSAADCICMKTEVNTYVIKKETIA
jgi:hypothetical protein